MCADCLEKVNEQSQLPSIPSTVHSDINMSRTIILQRRYGGLEMQPKLAPHCRCVWFGQVLPGELNRQRLTGGAQGVLAGGLGLLRVVALYREPLCFFVGHGS